MTVSELNNLKCSQCCACHSVDIAHLFADRWQCRRCRWLLRLDAHGKTHDYFNMTTAGRGKARR